MNRRLSTTTVRLLASLFLLFPLSGVSPAWAAEAEAEAEAAPPSRPVPLGDVMAGEFALQ